MTETPLETDPTAYRNLKNARPLAGRIAHHWMPRRPRLRGILAFLGPGLITGASDDDPSGIATYSQVGAQFGYSMAWVMLFTWPLMTAIQEVSARIGRVTGDGIAGNIREHYPRWLLHVIVALLLGANIINLGADLGAMGAALGLLLGGPIKLYVVAFAVGCALLEIFARYENYVHDSEMDGRDPVRLCRGCAGGPCAVGQGGLQYPGAAPDLEHRLPRRHRRGPRHHDHALLLFLAVLRGGRG